ncbi:MAG: response regulator [Patescibacteria group bacterium]|jgi:CheY-like chemotaxis protein
MKKKTRKNRKILIIDDDWTIAQMYGERLDTEGYDVVWANDGVVGLEKILHHKPDLIILDLFMPNRGGLGVLRVLRSIPKTAQIPVIVLTAYPKEEFTSVAERYGISSFFGKASTLPAEIVLKVKEAMAVPRTVRKSYTQEITIAKLY